MAREQWSWSNEAIAARAIALGVVPVDRPNRRQGFYRRRHTTGRIGGRRPIIQPGSNGSSDRRAAERIHLPPKVPLGLDLAPKDAGNRIWWSPGAAAEHTMLPTQAATEPQGKILPPEFLARRRSLDDWKRRGETVTHDVEVGREKLTEAFDDWLAAEVPNPFPAAESLDSQARSFIEIRVAGGLDVVSGQLQAAVMSGLKMTSTGIGLNPAEATISAGIFSNLVLAPITGPLGKVATFFEAAGVLIGFATGAHPLALACIKLLAHDELPHVLSQGLGTLINGSHTDAPQSDEHSLMMQRMQQAIEQQLALFERVSPAETHALAPDRFLVPEWPSALLKAQDTPRERLWLCLGFVPKPSPSPGGTHTVNAATAAESEVTKPIVLPMGNDAFLKSLPEVLRHGSVSEVDAPTARTMSDLPEGRHVIVKMEGVGFGASNAQSGQQADYQHPRCLTGRCVPPDRPPCLCPCAACRSARSATHAAPTSRQTLGSVVPSPSVSDAAVRG